MTATVHLGANLLSTEGPMTLELASDMPTMVHLSVHLPAAESPTTVELAFRHVNNGASRCPLASYRKYNDCGVSLPPRQQRYISVSTYPLQKVQ